MTGLVKRLGSIGFTVFISVTLIVLLIISTSLEAINGTLFVQKFFYQTRWFDLLVSLLWVNIFCSTIVRFPFKKSHLGFLVTHLGILGILAGALISRAFAVEGQVMLSEGETSDFLQQSGYALAVFFPNREQELLPLHKGEVKVVLTKARLNAGQPFCPLKKESRLAGKPADGRAVAVTVKEVVDHVTEQLQVKDGGPQGKPNRALHVNVKSMQTGVGQSEWLMERDPDNTALTEVMAGAVRITMGQAKKTEALPTPLLRVLDKSGAELASINAGQKDLPTRIEIKKANLVIKNLTYYPYAAVGQDKKIINVPETKRRNPAVVFDLVDGQGNETRMIRFAFFPAFESMHSSGNKQTPPDVKMVLESGSPDQGETSMGGVHLSFTYGETNQWHYRVFADDKVAGEGDVTVGKTVAAGVMDLEFTVEETLEHAKAAYDIVHDKAGQGPLAITIEVPGEKTPAPYWVLENQETPVHFPEGDVKFSIVPKTVSLPFVLTLKEFRKIDYPGTHEASGYESDVVLQDARHGLTLEKTISMNRPLLYDGYKIFQTSYIDNPKSGKGSVFTVARNPGIPWIYISSVIACLGAMFQFYGSKEGVA